MFSVSIEAGGLIQRLGALAARASEIPRQVFEDIGTLLVESVHMNFEVGGRPQPWTPSKRVLKEGGQTLVQSGALMNSVAVSAIGDNFVEVGMGEGLPYALIHQFGGTIDHPGSDKFQVFEMDGHMIFTHHTKAHTIELKARRYFRIQDTDADGILNILANYIIRRPEGMTIV